MTNDEQHIEELQKTVADYSEQVERSADKDEFLENVGGDEETVIATLREAWDTLQNDPELAEQIKAVDEIVEGFVCADADDIGDEALPESELMEDE